MVTVLMIVAMKSNVAGNRASGAGVVITLFVVVGGIFFLLTFASAFSPSSSSPTKLTLDRRKLRRLYSQSNQEIDEESKCKEFLRWMYEHKDCQGDQNALQLSMKNGRRGLYAAQDVLQGDYLFAIPIEQALVIEQEETSDAERGFQFLQLQRQLAGEPDYYISWKPYFQMLPSRHEHFDATPDFWRDGEIQQLELPLFVNQVMEKKKNVEMLAQARGLDMEELQLATWLVNSRAVTLIDNPDNEDIDVEMMDEYLDDDFNDQNDDMIHSSEISFDDDDDDQSLSTTCVLIPLLDMINHSSDKCNTVLSVMGDSSDDDDDDGEDLYYAVVANRDIQKGEELLITYGSQEDSSCDLLLHYGFVPDSNPYDVDFVAWSGAEDDMLDCWSTSLSEDEQRLQELLSATNRSSIEETILKFRIRMKKAFEEYVASQE
jgi:SET domain